eukprot:scaffold19937_cov18-Tisochrysis_lutea.AAC.1
MLAQTGSRLGCCPCATRPGRPDCLSREALGTSLRACEPAGCAQCQAGGAGGGRRGSSHTFTPNH